MSTYYLVEPAAAPTTTPVYDYGSVYTTIANQLASIDTDTTGVAATVLLIAASLNTIATNSTTIAEKLTAIETYQKKVKELAEGTGIHFVSPWEWVGLVSLYKLFLEEGKILDTAKNVTPEQLAAAMSKFNEYMDKIKTLPTIY